MRQLALCGLIVMFVLSGCQRAGQYPPKKHEDKKPQEDAKKTFEEDWAWIKTKPLPLDAPIVFVSDSNPEWTDLAGFWNRLISPPAGLPTCHLGQSALGAVSALVLAGHKDVVKIKVPRGLPDPAANIPASNPPTLARWQLGKSLFYDRILAISQHVKYSCAKCHEPKHGFCDDWAINQLGGRYNTLSLINCVYNKHQFWDGRVKTLEEVLVRSLDDENVVGEARIREHIWSGLVPLLEADAGYRARFFDVFGTSPTQDNIAKALATYLRTILSGNSVYDRALSGRDKDKVLTAKQFENALTNADLSSLGQGKKSEAAPKLEKGYNLFHGKARCQACHPGALFTDHDFHNVGLGDSDFRQLFRKPRLGFPEPEPGRFAHVPVGMKESRLIGAYRTPTLRNLPRIEPYMHNGAFKTLEEVVDFFDRGISGLHENLAPQLLQGPDQPQRLGLTKEEIADLVLFLRALDGDDIDPILLPPGKK
jgi:cytochrome c peroxidase